MLPREIQQGRDGQEPPRSMRLWVAEHYRHFNSAVIKRAVDAYVEHLDKGEIGRASCRERVSSPV